VSTSKSLYCAHRIAAGVGRIIEDRRKERPGRVIPSPLATAAPSIGVVQPRGSVPATLG